MEMSPQGWFMQRCWEEVIMVLGCLPSEPWVFALQSRPLLE